MLDLGVLGDDTEGPAPAATPARGVSRRSLLLAGAGVAAAAGFATVNLRGGAGTAARPPPPTPAPTASVSSSTVPAPSASGPAVAVSRIGHPVLGGTAGWDLFGVTEGVLLRIEPATGRVTRTLLPAELQGVVSVVPVRDAVLLHRDEYGFGYTVPDGRPVTKLPDDLDGPGPVLPGPDPDHVWVPEFRSGDTVLGLRSVDGRSTSTYVRVPPFQGQPPRADGGGGLLFIGVGGVYRAGPGPARLVTSGRLVGLGGARVADAGLRRRRTLRGGAAHPRRRGAPAPVSLDVDSQVAPSPVSPDGRTLAYLTTFQSNFLRLALLDLVGGGRRDVDVALLATGEAMTTVVWSPDSRWLAVLGENGAPASGRGRDAARLTGRRDPARPGQARGEDRDAADRIRLLIVVPTPWRPRRASAADVAGAADPLDLRRTTAEPRTRACRSSPSMPAAAYSSSFARESAMSRLRIVSWPMRSSGPKAASSTRSIDSRSGW